MTTTTSKTTPDISKISTQENSKENQDIITCPYFLDCSIHISTTNIIPNQLFEWIKNNMKIRNRERFVLKGKPSKIIGKDRSGFDNSSMQNAMFNYPLFLKYHQQCNKLFISDEVNQIIRSISSIFIKDNQWNGKLEIEVGQPEQEGYSNGDRNTCKLKWPNGFDWDMNDNMYICNWSCICKVDGKSNQVSLVAGHETDKGYKDGNNDEARFIWVSGILCYQKNYHQSPIVLYGCDGGNHCIRMIDVTNKLSLSSC